jgi:hypothetical protein
MWAGARSPLWQRHGPGSGSALGGPGGAVEDARQPRGPGWSGRRSEAGDAGQPSEGPGHAGTRGARWLVRWSRGHKTAVGWRPTRVVGPGHSNRDTDSP